MFAVIAIYSGVLLFTQETSVPASPSALIRVCIGRHECYVPGMVLRVMHIDDG